MGKLSDLRPIRNKLKQGYKEMGIDDANAERIAKILTTELAAEIISEEETAAIQYAKTKKPHMTGSPHANVADYEAAHAALVPSERTVIARDGTKRIIDRGEGGPRNAGARGR